MTAEVDVERDRNSERPLSPARRSWVTRTYRGALYRALGRLAEGELVLADGSHVERFGRPSHDGLAANVQVRDQRFYERMIRGGSLGASEAYMAGYWTCDELVALIRIACRNAEAVSTMDGGWARIAALPRLVGHWRRKNTLAGARRNIEAHYDLGNEFFALFLDPTMMYSCGVFERPDATMHEASMAKIERACRRLALSSRDHLVEIGTGWGGLAIHAATHYGCRVTTTTISPKQHAFATERVRAAGLTDRITVLFEDYRRLTGRFDKLVSIEMIEAIGHEYFDAYFAKCSELLKPDGMMLLETITVPDRRFAAHTRTVDFMKKYIFPGGTCPSVEAICGSVRRVSDLRMTLLEDMSSHYARTLELWRTKFWSQIAAVRSLGLSEKFIRTWDYYLAYCEAGFRERDIGVYQIALAKPRCMRDDYLSSNEHVAPRDLLGDDGVI